MRPNIIISGLVFLLMIGGLNSSDVFIKEIRYPSETTPGETFQVSVVVVANLDGADEVTGTEIILENTHEKAQLPDGTYEKYINTENVEFTQSGTKTIKISIKAWGKYNGFTIKLKPTLRYSINDDAAQVKNYDELVPIFITGSADSHIDTLKLVADEPASPAVASEPEEEAQLDEPAASTLSEDEQDTTQPEQNLANISPPSTQTQSTQELGSFFSTGNLLLIGGAACCGSTLIILLVVGAYIYYTKYYKKKRL